MATPSVVSAVNTTAYHPHADDCFVRSASKVEIIRPQKWAVRLEHAYLPTSSIQTGQVRRGFSLSLKAGNRRQWKLERRELLYYILRVTFYHYLHLSRCRLKVVSTRSAKHFAQLVSLFSLIHALLIKTGHLS